MSVNSNPYQPLSSLAPKFSPGVMFNSNAGANAAAATTGLPKPAPTSMGNQAVAPEQKLTPKSNALPPVQTKAPVVTSPSLDANGKLPDDASYQFRSDNGQPNPNYKAPVVPLGSFAQTDPNRIVNETNGQTAAQALAGQPANKPMTGSWTSPTGATVDTSTGQVTSPAVVQPPTYQGLMGQLVNQANQNQQIGQQARDTAQQYGAQYANVGQKGAALGAGQLTSGALSPVAEGNAAVTAQTTAAQQQALAQGGQLAQTGLSQQLLAQQQGQAGLQGATGLIPEALRYGGAAGGTLNPLNNLDSIAQQVVSGQISPAQAKAMGGSIPTWQGALNQAILAKNPQYNEGTAQANFDANQSNVQTGGTAAVGAAAGVYQKAYSDYQDLTQSVKNVDSFGSLLTGGMIAKDGSTINPTDSKWGNMAISEVRNQISDAQQAQFDSTYAALKSKISGLLAVGGNEIPSQITADANNIISGKAPFKTIDATLQRIQAEGNILLTSQAKKVNDALNQAKGGGAPSAKTSTGKGNTWGDIFG